MKTFILVTDGFDEPAVVDCLCRVRDEGASVNLVGLYSGLLSGCHGLTVRPDFSLNQIEKDMKQSRMQTAVILNGRSNFTSLLTDPRVHRLVEHTLNNQGLVAIMGNKSEWPLVSESISPAAEMNLLLQDRMDTDDFIQEIIRRITV